MSPVLRRRPTSLAALLLVVAGLLGAAVAPARAATRVDPALRFRRSHTPHFTLYFHDGSAAPAARLAAIVEETWTALAAAGWRVPGHTHVVLADQSDVANGWATPLPYNTVVLLNAWPSGAEGIGLADDWLRLVFVHEFTHIVHLDRSRGWARGVKRVFGRVPLAFPNLSLPAWQIEGLATYVESEVTGRGRRYAGDFRAIEREPARLGRALPIDRANGGLIRWPAGTAAYSSGLGFHQYLATTFGRERLLALAERTAGRLPYFGSTAFTPVFGQPLGELWQAYQSSLIAGAGTRPRPGGEPATRLTRERFDVSGVRFLAPTCRGCDELIAYSVRTPDAFPALRVVPRVGGRPRTLTTRYLGDTIAASRERIVFDQQQLARNVGLYGDLYGYDRHSGAVRQLTSGQRLHDPDLSGDGGTIVAVQQQRDRRRLVLLDVAGDGRLGPITPLRDDPEVHYSAPRWSPDGTLVAVERHRAGQTSEVVILSRVDGTVRATVRGATRAVTPAWRPDGKAIIVAADVPDGPFNLVEFPIDGSATRGRQLTDTTGGALWPDVSSDGRTLAYAGYTSEGYDVFTAPYPAGDPAADPLPICRDGRDRPAAAAGAAAGGPGAPADAGVAGSLAPLAGGRYTPWPTLAPRAWSPVVALDGTRMQAGVSTGGADVLGYHAWSTTLLWNVQMPDGALIGSPALPDWRAAYVYDRWQPQWFAEASRETSFYTGASARDGIAATRVDETVEAGVALPRRRVLRSQQWLLSISRSAARIETPIAVERFTRLAIRGGWSYRSSRVYGYSISPEDGVAVGLSAETAGTRAAALADATVLTGDARAYVPGFARHHVLAVRGGGGVSAGRRDLGRTFRLGGPLANGSPLDFGRAAFSLLRGFPVDTFAGSRIAVVNAEYRLPLRRVERGYGTWPLFVRQVHGSLFVDAAHAWHAGFRAGEIKTSAGAELSLDIVAGFALPVTVTAGFARGHDGSGRVADRNVAYLRIGRSF